MACLQEVLAAAVPMPAGVPAGQPAGGARQGSTLGRPGVLANIHARPVTEADLGFLRQLYAATRSDEMLATAWPASRRRAFLDQQFEFQHRHYRAQHAQALFLLLEQGGQPIGRLYWRSDPGHATLIDLSLMPAWRGQGIGTAVLHLLTAEADRRGQSIGLHVEPDNPALSLYRRFGFELVCDRSVHLQMLRPAPGCALPALEAPAPWRTHPHAEGRAS